MSKDVESVVRTMLVTAESEAPAPADLADRLLAHVTDPPRSTGHGRPWLAPVLAAAAVAAVVVGVTLGVRHTGSTPPGHKPTPVRPTPVRPTPIDGLTPVRCTIALPPAWKAIEADATSIAAPGTLYGDIAMDAAGGVVAVQYTSSHAYRVFDLRDGPSSRVVYETPDGQPSPEQGMAIRSVGAEDGRVALTVVVGQRVRIVLINLASGKPTTVRTIPTGTDMLGDARVVADGASDSGLTVTGGALYWAEIAQGQQHGRMYRYDISTGRRRLLDGAATSGPLAAAGGAVYWDRGGQIGSWPRGALVPTGVAWHMHPALLSTSGGTKVWQARSGAIQAQRGGVGPVTVVPAGRGWRLADVTGDFVIAQANRGTFVVDLRTGAAARWSAADDRVAYASPTAIVLTTRAGFDVVDAANLQSFGC